MEGELRLLRYFVAVADELNFGRAAATLHISQPPLSRAIRRLEDRTGAQLFVRTSRRVSLTPAGEALLPHARALVERADAATAAVRRVARGERSIAVGYLSSLAGRVVPELVLRLRRESPDLELELRESMSPEQLRDVRAGDIDVALLYSSRVAPVWADGLMTRTLRTEQLYAAFPRGHALAGRKSVQAADLASEDWISLAANALPEGGDRACHRRVEQGFNVVLTATTQRSALDLVAGGLGVCFAPYAATDVHLDAIAYVPVPGLSLDLVCVHAPEPGPTLTSVLAAVAAVAKQ